MTMLTEILNRNKSNKINPSLRRSRSRSRNRLLGSPSSRNRKPNRPPRNRQVNSVGIVFTARGHVASAWRRCCPPTIHPPNLCQDSYAPHQRSRTRAKKAGACLDHVCARAVRNMSMRSVYKHGACKTLWPSVTTGSVQHVGTNIV